MAGGHESWLCLHEGGQQPKQGWGCPQMQQCGVAFLFTSLPDTSPGLSPSLGPGGSGFSQPGRRLRSLVLKPLLNPSGQVSCPGVSSEYLDYLTPCMASLASCHLRAGRTMPPLVLLSPTVPWLACGFFFACSKSQSPGPALHLWAYQDPASPQPGPGGQMLPLGTCPQPTCPVVLYTTQEHPRLLCYSLATRW